MARYSTPNWSQVNVDDRAGMYALAQSADMLSRGFKDIGSVGNNYQEASKANALLERDKRSLALANQLRNVEGVDQARAAIASIDPEGWYDTAVINTASEQGLQRGTNLTTSKNTAEALGKIQGAKDSTALSKALEFMSQSGPYIDTNTTGAAVRGQNTLFESQFDRAQRIADNEASRKLNWAQFNEGRQDQAFNRQVSGIQLQNQLIAAERARLAESLKGLPLNNPTRIEANAKLQSLEEQSLSNQYKLAGLYGIDVSNFNTGSQYLGGNPTQVSNTTNVPVTTNVSTSTNVANTPVDWRQMLREQAGSFGEAGMPITSSGALKSTPVGFVDERQVVKPNVQQNAIQQPVEPAKVTDTRQIGLSRSEAKKAVTDNTQNKLSGFSQIPPTNYVNPVQERLKKDLVNIQNNVTYNTQPGLEGTLSNLSGSSDTLQSQLDLLLQKAKEDVVGERMSKVNVPVGSVTYTEILKEQLADPSLERAVRSRLNLDSGYRVLQSNKTSIDNEKKVFENYLKSRKDQSPEFLGDLRAAANEYVNVGDGSTFGDKYTNAPLVTAVTRLAQVDPKLSSYITGDKPTLESLQNRKKSDYTRMVESAKDYVKYNAPASAMLEDALKEFRAKSGREEVDVKSAANLINTLIEALGKIEAK